VNGNNLKPKTIAMRKQIFISLCLMLAATLGFSNITVSGILVDEFDEGVANHRVELTFFANNNQLQSFTLSTDPKGKFSQIAPRGFEIGGVVLFRYADCQNEMREVRRIIKPTLPPMPRLFRLAWCDEDPNRDSCAVKVVRRPSNSSDLILIAIPRGQAPFQFEWSNGDTTRQTTLSPGSSFCVTVTDATSCSAEFCSGGRDSCRVTINRRPLNVTDSLIQLTARYFPRNSAGTISYVWSTGDSTQSIATPLSEGEYCVTATGSNGCTASTCVTLPDRDTACLKAKISVERTPSGQAAILTVRHNPNLNLRYRWNTGETAQRIRVNESGIYIVRIFNPKDSCLVVKRVQVKLRECNVRIAVKRTAIGYRLVAIVPGAANQSLRFRWSTEETGRSIFVRNPNQRYCVSAIIGDCRVRDCIVPRWIRNRNVITIRRVRPAEYGSIALKAEGPKNYEYVWEDGTMGEWFYPDGAGAYTVLATSPEGEELQTTYRLLFSDLNSSAENEKSFVIYPNPAQHEIRIDASTEKAEIGQVRVYDLQGRMHKEVINYSLDSQDPIHISDLPAGMYTAQIQSETTLTKLKFVVH
jgi:hypothetical protein